MTKTERQSLYDIIFESLQNSGVDVREGDDENEIIVQDEVSLQLRFLNDNPVSK